MNHLKTDDIDWQIIEQELRIFSSHVYKDSHFDGLTPSKNSFPPAYGQSSPPLLVAKHRAPDLASTVMQFTNQLTPLIQQLASPRAGPSAAMAPLLGLSFFCFVRDGALPMDLLTSAVPAPLTGEKLMKAADSKAKVETFADFNFNDHEAAAIRRGSLRVMIQVDNGPQFTWNSFNNLDDSYFIPLLMQSPMVVLTIATEENVVAAETDVSLMDLFSN
jgi:hypothetical protein